MSLDRHDQASVLHGLDESGETAGPTAELDDPPSGAVPWLRPAALAPQPACPDAEYEVLGELGRGSRTVAYRVRRGNGVYAMKLPRVGIDGADPRDLDGEPVTSASERAFRREAALLACLNHPGLARVHEVGLTDGRPYLVMDLVEGRRLTDVLADGPLGIDALLTIGIDVADALAAAHHAGLVHRDIKPDNIIVGTGAPAARVIDFDLAARLGAPPEGEVAGTMLYCAPEQSGMLHRPVDGRADFYALGAVLYECATGAPPFDTADVGALLRMHASIPAPDPRVTRRDLPPALSDVIGKLLAKDPDDRYQSGAGLVADLRRLAEGTLTTLGTEDSPATGKPEPPMVGRNAELATLAARWQRLRDAATGNTGLLAGKGAGAGGAALITGAPGSGKSRLARELTTAVAAKRGVVLYAKCDADASAPLAPLRSALDRYVAQVQALPAARRVSAAVDLTAAAGPAASLLHNLSPALGALIEAPPPVADDRNQPLAGAVAGFLAALARSAGGLVLHLDDVHWLDDATRRVIRQLADELPSAPVLILATARDDPANAVGTEAAKAALGQALDLTVALEPLSPAAVAELVAGVTGGITVSGAAAASLAARSDGNPFTLLQYLTAMVDAGLARPSWGTWQIDADLLHGVELPLDAVELVLGRLRGLDAESRQLLGIAAALGPHFDPAMVAEVGQIHRRRVIEVASAAAWRHLLERRDGDNFRFLHDRIREALLAQFDPATLQSVHARIADVLAAQDQSVPATVYALASHCLLAADGRPDQRLFEACAAAGRLALADQAPAEAVAFLERAAAAARQAGIITDARFLQAFGLAQHRVGRFRDALNTLQKALTDVADPAERARLLALVAQVHDSTWATAEQAAAVDQALVELGRPLPRNRFVLVVSTLSLVAVGCLIGLVRIGRGTVRGERRELYCLLSSLYDAGALAYARQLRPTVALAYTLRRVYYTNRIGPGPESARMKIAAAHLAFVAGLSRLGQRLTRSARRTAESVGDPQLTAFVDWLAACDRHFFGLDQGETVRQVLAERARWMDAGHRIDLLSILCWDTLLRGDVAAAEDVFARRQTQVKASDGTLNGTVHGSQVGLLAIQGRAAEAAAQLARLRLTVTKPENWEQLDQVYVSLLAAVEQRDLGAPFDTAADELAGSGIPWYALIPIQRGLYVYLAHGRIEQSRAARGRAKAARLSQARAAVRTLRLVANTPMLRAHYQVARAGLREVQGKPAAALRVLAQAEPVLRAVDAPLVAYEAARVRANALRTLGVTGEADRQARYALGLAVEQRWPHRTRQLSAEFGLDGTSRLTVNQARSSDGVAVSLYRQRLDAIQQLGAAASRVLDPIRLAVVALDETIRILGAERAFLFLVDETTSGGQLHPYGGRDAEGNNLGTLTGYSATLVDRVWQSHTAMVVTGAEEGAALGAQSVVLHGLRSIMVAPLLLDGRLLGVVYLDSRVAKGIFTADDVGVLTAITHHIAVALETARASQLEVAVTAANRQRDLAETLRDALAEITGILEPAPEQVLRRVLAVLFGVVGGDRGWLVRPADPLPKVWVSTTTATGRHRATDQAEDELPQVVADADARLARLLQAPNAVVGHADAPQLITEGLPGTRCWLALPLIARGERFGVLLFAATTPDTYDGGIAEIASALVGQGMVAYENARLFAQVRQLATIDGLTGVANRRHFFELAGRDLERLHRDFQSDAAGSGERRKRGSSSSVAAMMIDIDRFKRVNDEYGHQVGDEVIQAVASRLRHVARAEDLLGRYGGEEFALLLRATAVEATRVAERLRATVADSPVPTTAGPLWVTISLGVTYLRDTDLGPGPSPESLVSGLLARADRCLYLAKHAGRNRVHIG